VKTAIRVQQLEENLMHAVQSSVSAAVTQVLSQQGHVPAETLAAAVGVAATTACAATLQVPGLRMDASLNSCVHNGSSVAAPVSNVYAFMRGLPRGFQLTSLSLENLFNCWHIGHPFPYKLITRQHLRDVCSDADVLQRQCTTMSRYRTCASAIEDASGMQVQSDASNLKDVFDAGIHKLGLEFSIDKDTAATYAHEVMRKRRRSDDSVEVSAPARRTPVAPLHTSVASPPQEHDRAVYGKSRHTAEKTAEKRHALEEAARQYDIAELARRVADRNEASHTRKTIVPSSQATAPVLASFDESDCEDAVHWPSPLNVRACSDSRRCFPCTRCQSWHRDKKALNQHGNRRHPPWENVDHVRGVEKVMWCLKSGARNQWSPALN
jgi:hypothetical protein